MKQLPISLCILAWNSGEVLEKTLETYRNNGLLHMVNDTTILFQQFNTDDYKLALEYNVNIIAEKENIGIGKGFKKLAKYAETDNVLLLEHDWNLVENKETTYLRLSKGLQHLDNGLDVVRFRHRKHFGEPLFSKEYIGKELTEYDKVADNTATHLLESQYWLNPALEFSDKIELNGEYYITTSRYANFTNNPCLYKKDFYLNCIEGYEGKGIELEMNISHWWCRQNFKVGQGKGLFKHNDFKKYGMTTKDSRLI